MFTAEEDATCFSKAKNMGGQREFAMPFVDAMGKEAFKLNKGETQPLFRDFVKFSNF